MESDTDAEYLVVLNYKDVDGGPYSRAIAGYSTYEDAAGEAKDALRFIAEETTDTGALKTEFGGFFGILIRYVHSIVVVTRAQWEGQSAETRQEQPTPQTMQSTFTSGSSGTTTNLNYGSPYGGHPEDLSRHNSPVEPQRVGSFPMPPGFGE